MSPPRPVLLVPLLIWPPLLRFSAPVVMDMLPASPHTPEHFPPIVEVTMPLARTLPVLKSGSAIRLRNAPEMEMESAALMVTLPARPLLWVVVMIRAPQRSEIGRAHV